VAADLVEVLRRIWSLRQTMSVYDAAYAALAEALERPLVSVDGRLLEACRQAGIPAVHLDDFAVTDAPAGSPSGT
jgi:predicted nucleic acid-binding protein